MTTTGSSPDPSVKDLARTMLAYSDETITDSPRQMERWEHIARAVIAHLTTDPVGAPVDGGELREADGTPKDYADRSEALVDQATDATAPITIYGASDDLVEVAGAVCDEYDLGHDGTRLRLTAPDGASLDVIADFGNTTLGGRLEWNLGVAAVNAYPSWPIRFHERPDYEGDPAVTIDAPAGTTVTEVTR